MEKYYRFRPVSRLLGEGGELVNQEIFFAHPSRLNDPMEGYRDIIWSGDKVAWTNLFRHYIFCLLDFTVKFLIDGGTRKLTSEDIAVAGSIETLPTDHSREVFRKISKIFLETDAISLLIERVTGRVKPIRREELEWYLSSVHLYALKIVFDVLVEDKLSPDSNKLPIGLDDLTVQLDEDYFKHLNDLSGDEENIRGSFLVLGHMRHQLDLIQRYRGSKSDNQNLLLSTFTSLYISRLESICFPEWYAACFMSDCSNSSVWGHYGSNHSGVCLIFEPEEVNGIQSMKLNVINGWCSSKGETRGWVSFPLYRIKYEEKRASTDFFRSLGALPMFTVNSMWHYSEDGVRSCCADFMSSEEEWREDYWNKFYNDITIKTNDWSYEKEHRLVLHSSLTDFSEVSSRKLKYEFGSLHGIIFGIKTTEEEKLEIMKIIEQKCIDNGREEFKFYQAYFCPKDVCIKNAELNLISRLRGSPDSVQEDLKIN